jgi:hypothetical protein
MPILFNKKKKKVIADKSLQRLYDETYAKTMMELEKEKIIEEAKKNAKEAVLSSGKKKNPTFEKIKKIGYNFSRNYLDVASGKRDNPFSLENKKKKEEDKK